MQEILYSIIEDKKISNLINCHKTSIHVAILMKRNKILATATNKIGSRSRGAGWSDCTIHAERNVVKELGDYEQLRGCSMYVIRISRCKTKFGLEKIQNSAPCYDCHIFLEKCVKQYGLKDVMYSTHEFVKVDFAIRPEKRAQTPIEII